MITRARTGASGSRAGRAVCLVGLAGLTILMSCCGRGASSAASPSSPKNSAVQTTGSTPTTDMKQTPSDRTSAGGSSGPTSALDAKVVKSDAQWKQELSPEQYHVLREKGTERAFTGKYWNTTASGVYHCAGCGAVLFTSKDKFASECGWPAFSEKSGSIDEHVDTSFGMVRTEVTCAKCGGHLGHVFDDGPGPKGLRYCINSASIDLEEDSNKAAQGEKSEQKPSTESTPTSDRK